MFMFGSQTEDSEDPHAQIEAEVDAKGGTATDAALKYQNKFQHQFREQHDYVIGYQFPAAMRTIENRPEEWEAVYVEPLETKDEGASEYTCFAALRRRYHSTILYQVLLIEQNLIWEILVFASIVINCSLASFYFYFRREEYDSLFPWIHLLDLVYLADFVLAAIATYTLTWRRFFKMKRRSNLAIATDIVSLLPLDFIYHIAYSAKPRMLFYLHLNSFLRIYRVFLFFKRRASLAGARRTLLFYARYITLLLVAIHVLSCLWYNSKASGMNKRDWTDELKFFAPTKDWEWYLLCSYYSLATFVNLGYGDIHSTNRFEYITSSFAMVLGFLLTTVMFIGSLSSQSLEKSTKLNDYRTKITAIKSRLKAAGFSPEEVNEQLSFFEVMWYKNFLCIIESTTALQILPVSMRKELCFGINTQLYKTSFLLQQVDDSHLRTVALFIKSEFYHPGDIILHRGTVKEKLIMVKFGEIDVVSEEDDESSILTFSAGTCLAECALVMVWPAKTVIRARTFTELQVIHHADFNRILADYPEIIQKLRTSVEERIAMAQAVKQQKTDDGYYIGTSLVPMRSLPDMKIIKQKLELKERTRKRTKKVAMPQEDRYLELYETERPRISSYSLSATSVLPVLCMGNFPWILLPDTVLTKVWQYGVVMIALVIAFLYPHLIAFTKKAIPSLDTFHIFVEAMFVLDIYVQCTTAMEVQGELIARVRSIIARQIRTYTFFLDVLAALPLEWFSLLINGNRYRLLFRTNKLLKCWKIMHFFNQKESDLWANVLFWKIVKYTLFLLIAAYWSAALLFIAVTYNHAPENNWLQTLAEEEKKNHHPDPLYASPELLSLCFSLNTLCGVGFTNITPKNFSEVGMIICLILMGILLLGYYMAEFSTTFYFGGRLRSMYQEKFITTLQFMKEKDVNSEILGRALNFLYVQWEYDKGNSIAQEVAMFPTISEKHQEHILLKEMVETLQQAPIFQLTDLNMLMLMAKKARVRVLPPGEYIYRAGTWMMTMYIIQEGFGMELDQYDEDTGRVLGPGSELGALGMFYRLKSIRAIRTITHCKLISIKRKTFTRITSIFPLIWETNNEVTKEFNDRVTQFFDSYNYIQGKRLILIHPASLVPEIEKNKIHKYILNTFQSSFQRTNRKSSAENYWKPFRNLGVLEFLGHLFMPWSLLPTSNFLKSWCIARAITVWIVAVYLPVDKTLDMAGVEEKWWMVPVDTFAFADIYLMFHVAYYNSKGVLVTHPYYTGMKYFKTNFFFDLIAFLPFDLLIKTNNGSLRQLLRMNRILQAYRLIGAFEYLGENIFQPQEMLQLFKHLPMVLIIANVATTIFVIFNCDMVTKGVIECSDGSFIQHFNHENSTRPLHIYAIGYYWVASTLFSFGLVNPYTSQLLPLTIALVVLGFLLFGFICAIVSSNKLQKNIDLMLYKDKINELKVFMNQESIPTPIKDKIVSHFEYMLFRTKGVEIQELFPFFNQALKEDVYLSHYERIFSKVPTLASPNNDFIRHIGGQIREYFFIADETIIRANYIESNVYIIARGEVKIFNQSGHFLAELGSGDLFGNLQNSNSVLSNITATCVTDTDILLVACDWFQENLEFHPLLKERIASQLEDTQEYIKQDDHDSHKLKESSDDTIYVLPVSLKPIRYMSTSVLQRSQDSSTKRWWEKTIMPHSPIIAVMDVALLVCSYISCLKVTFQFTFQYHWPVYVHLLSLMDLFYFLNMFLQTRKAYNNKYGKVISKPRLIAYRYLHSKTFAFDLIINTPYYLGAFALSGDQHVLLYSILQLIHLLRMYYIFKFYRDRRRAASAAVNASAIIVWTSLFAHFCACILYFVTCPLHQCRENSWILKSYGSLKTVEARRYFVALYYALQVLTGTCYGYIQPYYLDEICVLTALLIVVKFAVCVLIADVTDLFCSEDRVLKTYERNMNILHDMIKSQNASPYLKTKVNKYVHKLWKYEHGVQKPSLLDQMPYQLKIELLWAVYGHHLEEAFPFKELDRCFLQQLVIHLNHTVYFTDNYVVRSGDVDLRMHFIHRGEVAVLSVQKNHSEIIHEVLTEGHMFGLAQGLYRGMPHCFSYRAKSNTDVLSLNLDSWSYLLYYYPTLQKEIYDRINSLRKIPDDDQ